MTRLFLLLFILSALSFFGISPEADACSTQDRIDLSKAGYSRVEVEGLCEQEANQPTPPPVMGVLFGEGQAQWLQWCVTPQGRCPLFSEAVGYYPIGFPCNCYMPWGFYAGTAQ